MLQKDPVTEMEKRAVRHAAMLADAGAITLRGARLDEIGETEPMPEAIPVGTVEFCRAWMARCGIQEPEPLDFPEPLRRFLGRKVERFEAYEQAPEGLWVKPVRTKAWDARVKGSEDPLAADIPEGPVWASEPIGLVAEWRVYVLEGREVGFGRYDDGEAEAEFCRKALGEMLEAFSESGLAPRAYALDLALGSDGKTRLMEATDAWAIGHYKGSCSPAAYAEMLAARWEEIAQAPKLALRPGMGK